jgi:hypothetical protein
MNRSLRKEKSHEKTGAGAPLNPGFGLSGDVHTSQASRGETLAAVQIAMIAGLPYTALRDAVLTHPTLVEGLISLFSSAASAHNVVETRGTQISAA